jgi:hypothetical protein
MLQLRTGQTGLPVERSIASPFSIPSVIASFSVASASLMAAPIDAGVEQLVRLNPYGFAPVLQVRPVNGNHVARRPLDQTHHCRIRTSRASTSSLQGPSQRSIRDWDEIEAFSGIPPFPPLDRADRHRLRHPQRSLALHSTSAPPASSYTFQTASSPSLSVELRRYLQVLRRASSRCRSPNRCNASAQLETIAVAAATADVVAIAELVRVLEPVGSATCRAGLVALVKDLLIDPQSMQDLRSICFARRPSRHPLEL